MKSLERLRIIGNIEGISYLVLLGIAMPMKYMGNMPQAVRIAGSVHGFLFVAFLYCPGGRMAHPEMALRKSSHGIYPFHYSFRNIFPRQTNPKGRTGAYFKLKS